jgi:hypothetical protein
VTFNNNKEKKSKKEIKTRHTKAFGTGEKQKKTHLLLYLVYKFIE